MITLTCDNCDKQFEVGDDQVGKKVKCPGCGDVNIVPGGKPAGRPDRAAAAGYPPDSGPEQRVMRVRPEMMRAKPMWFLLHMIVLLGGVGGAIYFGAVNSNSAGLIVSGIAGVLALGSLLVWKISNLGSALEITNKRSIERVGLFSKFTSEILHDDIRNIQVTQSFKERMLGIGTIGISSAGQDGVEIVVKDIRSPDKIREVIDLYRPM